MGLCPIPRRLLKKAGENFHPMEVIRMVAAGENFHPMGVFRKVKKD